MGRRRREEAGSSLSATSLTPHTLSLSLSLPSAYHFQAAGQRDAGQMTADNLPIMSEREARYTRALSVSTILGRGRLV